MLSVSTLVNIIINSGDSRDKHSAQRTTFCQFLSVQYKQEYTRIVWLSLLSPLCLLSEFHTNKKTWTDLDRLHLAAYRPLYGSKMSSDRTRLGGFLYLLLKGTLDSKDVQAHRHIKGSVLEVFCVCNGQTF